MASCIHLLCSIESIAVNVLRAISSILAHVLIKVLKEIHRRSQNYVLSVIFFGLECKRGVVSQVQKQSASKVVEWSLKDSKLFWVWLT